MKIIIVGGGSVGFQLARHFIAEKKDVILIEKDVEKARDVLNKLDCIVINDSATSIDVLRQAGIADADYFIAVTDSDEVNLICCGLANNKSTYKIARVSKLDFKSTNILNERLNYIDLIVNPEVESSKKIIRTIEHGAISDIIFFKQAGLQMRNLLVSREAFFYNKSVKEISNSLGNNFLVAGIVRQEKFIIPNGSTQVESEDNIYFLSTPDVMESIYEKIGISKIKIKKILIVGGGRIGRQVARHFISNKSIKPNLIKNFAKKLMGRDEIDVTDGVKIVKILDNDYEKCKKLAKALPESMVINADISDETIFKEENLADFDLIITTTPSHELNVLAALYAKKVGIKRAVCVVSNMNYIHIAIRLGIDVVVSPRNSVVDPILNFIGKGNIKNIHSISDTETDIFEVALVEGSPICGKPVKDLKLPPPSLVLSVKRGDSNFVPDGSSVLLPDDHILIMTKQKSVARIEEMTCPPLLINSGIN